MNKNKPDFIERSFNFEVRAEQNENGSTIEGSPVVYDSKTDLGWFYEVIEKGALDETDLTDVRFLVNHDINKIPLARSRKNNGNSTMQLTPNDNGLDIRAMIDTENNADAKALYSAVSRGDISGMSFMFSIDGEEWEDLESEKPTRRIKKIASIIEVSAVTFPAYQETSITARSAKELESLKTSLENARAALRAKNKSLESEKSNLSKELRMLNKIYN